MKTFSIEFNKSQVDISESSWHLNIQENFVKWECSEIKRNSFHSTLLLFIQKFFLK